MMKRIGGCPVWFFCSAACEVAAPIGKLRKNKASNIRENRCFIKTKIAKRTIKSPHLYMAAGLAIALNRSSRISMAVSPSLFPEVILFLSGPREFTVIHSHTMLPIPKRY
ncbi:hypothetical protein [Rhizobium esperanzae]|uniref:Uncharacterized protein n=1 Tax=Rhizobium esperanzae TaxID=1967781 RepID=A0A7W6W4R9_9HYPH|nr:hypothetical protein [Rhizobium esperanzae]MBB4235616.1 hypothetical protein [Rhizobium esperanzae]